MTKALLLFISFFALLSCSDKEIKRPLAGTWRAQLEVMDGQLLPFLFDWEQGGKPQIIRVRNAEEIVTIDDILWSSDSVIIRMPVYEGYIKAAYSDSSLTGNFIKESLDRVVPFTASFGSRPRFYSTTKASVNISGSWETEFSPNSEEAYMAKGIFTQEGNRLTGTFRTPIGDYRYLDGVVSGDSMSLSTFDGAHAFLFRAKLTDSTMNGVFYSGNHFKESFTAKRHDDYELEDPDNLTFLREGYDSLSFAFPEAGGKTISLSDPEFDNKVIIVQVMGTWCPNCMDETKFLVEYLRENAEPDLVVIALAFEYAKTEEAAFGGIERLKRRLGVDYPVLLAQYGTSSKIKANEKLPMLNQILSYPTTIFVDKMGKVRWIHTGFNGPATGYKYKEFKAEFAARVGTLLRE